MNPEAPSNPRGLPGAQVTQVLELVNYQDGSVVSREVVKLPNGGVTTFAFDEGQNLSEHTAPFDALVQVLEGEAECASLAAHTVCMAARWFSCPRVSRTRSRRSRGSK